MEPERWERLESLFAELADQPLEERARRLRDSGIEPELERELAGLLAAHDRERPLALEARLVESAAGGFAPGRRIGPYELVEPIGRGGMGEVWAAERDEAGFRRRVAIKRVRRGLESEELLARFRTEHRVLARLVHRSIAQLLDAGVDESGVPFLVLEYVDGTPITVASDAGRLSLDARLALFEEVCRAVAFAHARLVVHRDLKPGNILVTAGGEVRLLDFGIAKLLEADEDGEPAATRTRGVLATPEYASPEQLAGEPVTTSTDVYALGVLLHELVAGDRPFARHESTPLEHARAVVEGEPEPPSAAALRGDDAARQARAAARSTTPRELARRLRGDLDTIVATALRREPARRYPSVERLAEDVARLRAGRTVGARPDSAGYRLRKFVGRHRAAVTAAVGGAILLAGMVIQVARQSAIASRERDAARAERDAAREVTELLVALFDADPYATGDTARDQMPLGEFLVASEAKVRRELADRPELRARLATMLARLNANLGRLEPALALAEEAVAERRRSAARDEPALAESLNILGTALQESGDYAAAERAFREALTLRERALGEYHADTGESVNNLAVLLSVRRDERDFAEAERLERRALEIRRRVLGDRHLDTAQSLNNLAAFLYQRRGPGDLEAAAELLEEALEIREGELGADHPFVANTRSNLANVLLLTERADEAEALFREALRAWSVSLGSGHARLASGWWGLAWALERRGDFDGAIAAVRRTIEIEDAALPEDHPNRRGSSERLAELEANRAARAPAAADATSR